MNYWLHSISNLPELSYPLFEKGYLTIGFSDFTNRESIEKVNENDRATFEKQFLEKGDRVSADRHILWRFLKFSKGDIVVVPGTETFHVCEIIDDRPFPISETLSDDLKTLGNNNVSSDGTHLISENGDVYDLGFARRVRLLHKKVSIAKFADAKLTTRMKIDQTNSSINDLEKSLEESIDNYLENEMQF